MISLTIRSVTSTPTLCSRSKSHRSSPPIRSIGGAPSLVASARAAGVNSPVVIISCAFYLFIRGCLRCLLLVMCTHPFAKEALTLHLARSEGHECYFGYNLMHCRVLASSHQHLMAEAPDVFPFSFSERGWCRALRLDSDHLRRLQARSRDSCMRVVVVAQPGARRRSLPATRLSDLIYRGRVRMKSKGSDRYCL